MTKGGLLVKNTLIIGFGKIFTALIGFLLLPVYTRYLSVNEYGLMDLVVVYGALVAPIVGLRLELAVFRWLIEKRGNPAQLTEAISSVFYMFLTCTAAFSALYVLLLQFVAIPHAGLVGLYVTLVAASGILMQIARGLGRVNTFVVGSSIVGVATTLATLLTVVILNMKLQGALISLIAGHSIAVVYMLLNLRLWKYISRGWKKDVNKDMLRFSIPLIPQNISWWLTFAFCKVIIANVLGVAAAGIYAVSSKFMLLFSGLYEIFDLSWTEAASVNIDAADKDDFFSTTFNVILKIYGACLLMILAGIPILFPFVVSGDYNEAYIYIPLMLAAVFVNVINRFISAIYVAKKKTKQIMNTASAAAAISVGLNIILIPLLGIWGAAISLFVAYMFIAVHRFRDVQKYVRLVINRRAAVWMLASYLAVTLAYYQKSFTISAISLVALFLLMLHVNRQELQYMKKMVAGKFKRFSGDTR